MAHISGNTSSPLGVNISQRLRFTALTGTGDVLMSTPQELLTAKADGVYSFELVSGKYSIEVFNDGQWNLIGKVEVDGNTPAQSLNELIANHSIVE